MLYVNPNPPPILFIPVYGLSEGCFRGKPAEKCTSVGNEPYKGAEDSPRGRTELKEGDYSI
jgi:hypothetical protein